MTDFLQLFFSGLATGSIYALAALGFTLLWQASGTINFAQGEFVMLPAFMMIGCLLAGMPLLVSFCYDYLIVCSVADGLNLVVKEGAILNTRNGVIVSTANVGAMAELGNFCVLADDSDEVSIARALVTAKKLDLKSREEMSVKLKKQITEFSASHWAQSVTASLKLLQSV